MNPETLQKCSTCGCYKLLKFFKIRGNTGQLYKTCMTCLEKYKCPDCDFTCSSNSDLKRHIKQVHDQIKDFNCPDCDYTCSTNYDLKRHIKQVHDQIKDINCPDCDFTCSTNSCLKRHIKQVHDQIKDVECPLCDYKCSTNSALKSHTKQIHDQIKDFECPMCDYKCSTNGDLQRHLTTCTGANNTSISGLEMRCMEALFDLGFEQDTDYIYNKSFSELTDWSGKTLRPDIRFINHKIIIETDGEQHFKPRTFGSISQEEAEENFKIIQHNDKLKNDFCRIYGYKMIRIPYTKITDILGILHNELEEILDF
jgi:hypothetical protein